MFACCRRSGLIVNDETPDLVLAGADAGDDRVERRRLELGLEAELLRDEREQVDVEADDRLAVRGEELTGRVGRVAADLDHAVLGDRIRDLAGQRLVGGDRRRAVPLDAELPEEELPLESFPQADRTSAIAASVATPRGGSVKFWTTEHLLRAVRLGRSDPVIMPDPGAPDGLGGVSVMIRRPQGDGRRRQPEGEVAAVVGGGSEVGRPEVHPRCWASRTGSGPPCAAGRRRRLVGRRRLVPGRLRCRRRSRRRQGPGPSSRRARSRRCPRSPRPSGRA